MNDREFDAMIRARAEAEAFSVPEKTRARLDRALRVPPRRRVSRRVLLVAAVLIVALAGIAYAAVRGGYLRNLFTGDASDIDPESVVDVDATGGTEEFSFTIDEVYWEGGQLWLSYTLKVPGDGVRLVAFGALTMDGTIMEYRYHQSVEDALLWVAEDGVSEMTGALAVFAEVDEEPHEIVVTAYLMEPIAPMQALTEEEKEALRVSGTLYTGDILYYEAGDRSELLGGGPTVQLYSSDQMKEFLYVSDEEVWDTSAEVRRPNVETLKEMGFAQATDSAQVTFEIDGAAQVNYPVTGVFEDEIDMGDYTIRIPEFTMFHFGMNVLIRIYADGDLPAGLRFDIQTPDGTSLVDRFYCAVIGGGSARDEENRYCVGYLYDGTGFLGQLPTEVVLIAYTEDENGERVYDTEHASTLTLIVEEEEVLLAGMAYATEGGTYYHSDLACTGMIGAEMVSIKDAEARGQKPCPVCMGD